MGRFKQEYKRRLKEKGISESTSTKEYTEQSISPMTVISLCIGFIAIGFGFYVLVIR